MIRGRYPGGHPLSKGIAVRKKCVVEMTEGERHRLRKQIRAGETPARILNRACVLLEADIGEHAGWAPALDNREIAGILETSPATLGRVRERFWCQGLDAALERSMPDRSASHRRGCQRQAKTVAKGLTEGAWVRASADAARIDLRESDQSYSLGRRRGHGCGSRDPVSGAGCPEYTLS